MKNLKLAFVVFAKILIVLLFLAGLVGLFRLF